MEPRRIEALVGNLATECGLQQTQVSTDDLDAVSTPARGTPGRAAAIVFPSSTEEVRRLIGWARQHRVRLLPQGANTGLVGASTPPPGEPTAVVLSTHRLNSALSIDPLDRSATVSAGIRLSRLNEVAAEHGLRLPIDVGSDPALGGMASTNTGGARMIRDGDMRSHVLGIEAVLADEEVSVIDSLRSLRKDNTGLDLTRLIVGSSGALGVITQVSVSLAPVPSARACAWVHARDADVALECLGVVEKVAGPHMSAFEVVSAPAMAAALGHIPTLHAPTPDARTATDDGSQWVLIEVDLRDESTAIGDPEGFCTDLVVSVLEQLDRHDLMIDGVLASVEEAWQLRHSVTEGLRLSGKVLGFDVSVPRSQLPALIEEAAVEVRRLLARARLCPFGHWGDGATHLNVVVPFDDPVTESELGALRDALFGLVTDRFGGSYSAEHGIGPVNAQWWRTLTPQGNKLLTHRIKSICDPLGILGHPGLPY